MILRKYEITKRERERRRIKVWDIYIYNYVIRRERRTPL